MWKKGRRKDAYIEKKKKENEKKKKKKAKLVMNRSKIKFKPPQDFIIIFKIYLHIGHRYIA